MTHMKGCWLQCHIMSSYFLISYSSKNTHTYTHIYSLKLKTTKIHQIITFFYIIPTFFIRAGWIKIFLKRCTKIIFFIILVLFLANLVWLILFWTTWYFKSRFTKTQLWTCKNTFNVAISEMVLSESTTACVIIIILVKGFLYLLLVYV